MRNEPCWIEPEGTIQLNQKIVASTGEPHLLVDRGLLEGACNRPKHLWLYEQQESVTVLATCLLFGIARNHAFIQGNKRTAWFSMIGFLGANSFRMELADDVAVVDAIIAVLEGRETEARFAQSLERVIQFADQERYWK